MYGQSGNYNQNYSSGQQGYYHHSPPPSNPGYAQDNYGYYPQAPPPAADMYSGKAPANGYYQQGAPVGSMDGTPYGGAPPKKEDMFPQKQPYNDVWAAILFIVHLIALGVIAAVSLGSLKDDGKGGGGDTWSSEAIKRIIGITFGMAGVALAFTILYIIAVYNAPSFMIIGTFFASIGLLAGIAAYAAIKGAWVPWIVFGLLAALNLLLFFLWRSRIPFAALMLKTVVSIMHKYPATVALAFASILVFTAFSALWIPTVIAVQRKFESGATYNVIIVFLIFNYYWTAQVVKNTVHVAIGGVFATYYFIDGTGQSSSNPTLGALKRAMTYSFGSICFGSLIVALIQTVRALLRHAFRDHAFARAIVDCLLSMIEGLVEYFNYYAYTQVAIYGKSFCTAAKDTWSLIKSHGIDAIINDQLIGNVLAIGALLVGLVCAGLGFLIAKEFVETNQAIFVSLISFLIGFFFMSLVTQVIESGTATTFVCIAENPHAISQTKPELYQKIRETYPEVMLQ